MNGGVSMAVWIAGAVAEIDQLRGNDPYWRAVLTACGYEPAAQVDVLVGASAGGLNGVLMAQTIHTGQRFADTLELWHQRADLDHLVKGPRHAVRPPRAPDIARSTHTMRAAVRSTPTHRHPADVDPREILDGEYFRAAVREVLDHLRAAQTAPAPTHDLAVFASATLVAPNPVTYRDVPGAPISEATSEAYFHVAKRGSAHLGLDGFAPDDTVQDNESALAGIGRATSSLPGLFAPVTFLHDAFGPRLVGAFRRREEAVEVMDGGVIDNVPIARAIRAIYQSRASRRVRRVLVYLHPDPTAPKPSRGNRTSTSARTVVAAFFGKRGETLREDIDLLRAHNAAVDRRAAAAEALLDALAGAVAAGRVAPPLPTADAAAAIVPTPASDITETAEGGPGSIDETGDDRRGALETRRRSDVRAPLADDPASGASTAAAGHAGGGSDGRNHVGDAAAPGCDGRRSSGDRRGDDGSSAELDVVSSALGQVGTVGQLVRLALDPDAEMHWHAPSQARVVPLLDAPDDLDRPAETRARFAALVAERPDVLVAERGRRVARALTIVIHQCQRHAPAADFAAALAQLDELVLLCDLLNAYQFASTLQRDPRSTAIDRLARSAIELERLIASSPTAPPIERLATWNIPPVPDDIGADRLAADRGAVDRLLGTRVQSIIGSLPAISGDSVPERIVAQLADGALGPGNVALALLPLLIEPVASDQSITFVRAAGDVLTDASRAFMGERPEDTVARLGHRLAGKQLHHLGAFFAQPWRVNDTRWGQLDAVPALVEAIVDAEGFARLRDSGSQVVPADVIEAGVDATKRYLVRRRQGQLLAQFTGVAGAAASDRADDAIDPSVTRRPVAASAGASTATSVSSQCTTERGRAERPASEADQAANAADPPTAERRPDDSDLPSAGQVTSTSGSSIDEPAGTSPAGDGSGVPAPQERAVFDPALAVAEERVDVATTDATAVDVAGTLPGDDGQFERAVASAAFAEWRGADRRIVSLLGTRDLTSTAMRMLLTAVKVLGHRLGIGGRVALHLARPVVLLLGGLVLAGRWMTATLAWTLCVMAAPRIASPLGVRVVFAIGVAAVAGTVWLLATKIRPIRHRWLMPYALALAGVLVGLWFAVRVPSAAESVPVLGAGWPWKLVAVAAICSSAALFFWMRPIAVVAVTALLAAWYGLVAYVGFRAMVGEPVFDRTLPWWATDLLLAWAVAVIVMAWVLGELPDRLLRPRPVRPPSTS